MRREEVIEKLKKHGLKITPQRIAIMEIVLSSKDHPTASQVYEKVKKMYPNISPATVYQTLHLLSQTGLVQELGFSDGISRFDPNTSPHVNVICRKCGNIEDYRSEKFEKLWPVFIEDLNFKPIGQRIDIYTFCKKCSKTIPSSGAEERTDS